MGFIDRALNSDSTDLLGKFAGQKFGTILADPPWQFQNRTGKVGPEHKRLSRYSTMGLKDICDLPVAEIAAEQSHLYLWVPNALLPDGLKVMEAWGFKYVSNIVWEKIRKDREPDVRIFLGSVATLMMLPIVGSRPVQAERLHCMRSSSRR